MGLLDDDPDARMGPGRRRPWGTVAILAVLVAGAAWLFVPWSAPESDPGPTDAASPTARTTAPPPSPVTEPTPEPTPAPPSPPAPVTTAAPAPPPPAPAPPAIRLRVRSDVEGADVFIDRQFVGKTPFESIEIGRGPHRLNVSAPGHEGHSEEIVIGDTVTEVDVAFLAVRLDQRVAVVHRHRFGDCEGELVADLHGLHYRTDDDDAFSVAHDGVEEFTVDYLDHTLRLKVRDGRTYNFTDTEPNADRLYVFHRDVERARARLTDGS